MAKKSKESLRDYFTRVFEENLDWLDLASYAPIREQFKTDHGRDMTPREMQSMATLKAILRHKHKLDFGSGRGRRTSAKGQELPPDEIDN